MQYSELIKNFGRVRETMRDFFIYGFRTRNEYTRKSARSYDDERRRLESWLGEYMCFRQTPDGKNVFLTIDSRASEHNPLFAAWKSKSFTDGDITLHFILMDILDGRERMALSDIMEKIDIILSGTSDRQSYEPHLYDESTVRKKLKEYSEEGIIKTEKHGKIVYYSRVSEHPVPDSDLLDFFSEVSPVGVVGSFLLDKTDDHESHFAFKHHYITSAMDSGILYDILQALNGKKSVTLELFRSGRESARSFEAVPLKIMISVQSGRQYLMAYVPRYGHIMSCRLDSIISVSPGEVSVDFDKLCGDFERMCSNLWGVSTHGRSGSITEHAEFTIRFRDDEKYILQRLEREKRCGRVEIIDPNTARFSADVYDSTELIPWIRTFICRITDIRFSNADIEARFRSDLKDMYRLYGLDDHEGEEDDI